MSKSLAVVGRIIETCPIEGADFIQQCRVDCGTAGIWTGVAGKALACDELVTVFLQDALLMPNPRWAFMAKHHWRVRMARFKGVPSECVIIPGAPNMPPGTDLAEALGVTKYEKPIPANMAGDAAGAFPSFIPKTDEPNFQTVPHMTARLADGAWYAAEKADGASCTVWNDEAGMHVCSRNWELREFSASGASNVYWRAARKYGMERIPPGLALQFEVVGPGIQGNPMGLAALEVRVFSLYSITEHRYLSVGQLDDVCALLQAPPARKLINAKGGEYSDEALRKLAEIKYPNGKHGEGIVIRCLEAEWSFKVLNLLYKD